MNRALPRAASACTLALGLSLGGLVWADTATLPPGPLIDIDSTANSLGTAVDAATTKSNSLTGNSVTLTSGAVDGYAVGAINLEDTTAVTGNHVYINGGSVRLGVYGGWTNAGASVSNNTVAITAGAVSGNVVGGFGSGPSAALTGNSVTVSGGTVSAGVYGAAIPGGGGALAISNNTVTISGTPTFSSTNTILAGYQVICSGIGPCFFGTPQDIANNTLNLHSTGLTVANVFGFNNLNFYLPASLSTGTPVLTGAASLNGDTISAGVTTSSQAKITVQMDSTSPATLSDGATYTLISAPKGALYLPSSFTPVTGTITDATSTVFPYTVDVDMTSSPAVDTLLLKLGNGAPSVPPSSTAAVPATGPASLALLALLLAGTGWLARRGAKARR
jgi:hypothetical protein